MKKYYAITRGCYSDYHICDITDDYEKAKILQVEHSDEYEMANIEEYEEPMIEFDINVLPDKVWIVKKYKDGITVKIPYTDDESPFNEVLEVSGINNNGLITIIENPYLIVCVRAKTIEQAKKIAQDLFAEYEYKKKIEEASST